MILKLYRAVATKFKTFTNKNEMNEHIQLHTLKNKSRLNKSALETLKLISRHSVKITGVSWLNDETIQSHLGVSLRTIKRAIQRLCELDIVCIKIVEMDGIWLRYYVINRFELSPKVEQMVQASEQELSNKNEENNAEKSMVSREIEESTTTRNNVSVEHKETNDLNKRNYVAADSTSNEIDHSYLTHLPKEFVDQCKPFFDVDQTYQIYHRATIAHSKTNLSMSLENYSKTLIDVLKQCIFMSKIGKVRKSFLGYWYKALEGTFTVLKRHEVGFGYNWLE